MPEKLFKDKNKILIIDEDGENKTLNELCARLEKELLESGLIKEPLDEKSKNKLLNELIRISEQAEQSKKQIFKTKNSK
jgi:hypothetical protein